MKLRVLVLCVAPCLLSNPAAADWVELKDGRKLRGIDLRPHGAWKRYTLDTGMDVLLDPAAILSVTKSPPGETVDFRGKPVSLREMIRALKVEDTKREKEALKDIETWARAKKEALDARKRFLALPPEDRQRYLIQALARSRSIKARALAAGELATHKDRIAVAALTRGSVVEENRLVRATCLQSLKDIADPLTSDGFVTLLASPAREVRVRAAEGIESFPTQKAVPILIDRMSRVWADFGRGSIVTGTQRGYVRDHGLVSGGSGATTVEVADPEVSSITTGVVLDADVRKVEIAAYAKALKATTGEDFGTDVGKWREWWTARQAKDAKDAPKAAEPRRAGR